MLLRYLPARTEYNGQLRSALVIELFWRQVTAVEGEWVVSRIVDWATLQVEPADTVYLSGTLRGNLHLGAKASDLSLELPASPAHPSVSLPLTSVINPS